jgi:hypothetical protein
MYTQMLNQSISWASPSLESHKLITAGIIFQDNNRKSIPPENSTADWFVYIFDMQAGSGKVLK